ncbi:MAG TPA: TonB family protein [Gemmatimonadales bacterium]|nr:TonB family protein [Gemmatimonadales bacterium]
MRPHSLAWQSSNQVPSYPEVMRAVGIPGEVDVSFIVNPDGSVDESSITITRFSNRAFIPSVRNAVASWRLPLYPESGRSGAIRTDLSVSFALLGRCSGSDLPMRSLLFQPAFTRLIVLRCQPELVPRN